jgi:hypothetical protein
MTSLRSSILGCSLATLAAALFGCSSVDRAEEPRVVSDSQTGSNIPKKGRTDKVQTIDADALQPMPPPFRAPPGRAVPDHTSTRSIPPALAWLT